MARTLSGLTPEREQIEQSRLLDRLERKYRQDMRREILRASRVMARGYAITGDVQMEGEHEARLRAIYAPMLRDSVVTFASRIMDQAKSHGVMETKEGWAEFFARLAQEFIANEMIRRRITQVAETTRQHIIDLVSAGQLAGESTADIAKRINERIPAISRWRGALIARTETHNAANYGAHHASVATGLRLRKEWVSALDERTRLTHVEANGQIVAEDEPFLLSPPDMIGVDADHKERLMYPGDVAGGAGNTINCRCAAVRVIDD